MFNKVLKLFKKEKIKLKPKILIFCGAGISAESGLNTFRDTNGLWMQHDLDEVCNLKTFTKNREKVFEFYNQRKKEILMAKPNNAHRAIAELQRKYGSNNVVVFTTNVDDLLTKAGVEHVCYVHGNIYQMKCIDCSSLWDIGIKNYDNNMVCPHCKSINTKPGIIFFNEKAPEYGKLIETFQSSGVVINETIVPNIKLIIGTSLKVVKIDMLHPKRSRTIFLDANPQINGFENDFELILDKKATEGIEIAVEKIKKWYL